ncbi:serine hydrolase [Streptacidiphilus sp. MAP5-3]|uniref:serine hydrolase n=1 Tax=unclassified Streptacidiphilus TaxID=2643834 RepID=UPI0035138C66
MRLSRLLVSAGAVTALAVPGVLYGSRDVAAPQQGTTSPAPAPPSQQPPQLSQAQVSGALGQLDGVVQDAMQHTGVPGVAVGVVYQDKTVYAKGFGVREVGKTDRVDPGTVFQLASMSKPLASTVVAQAVGRKVVGWDDPVVAHDPGFVLKDPYVTAHVTIADLFSHRSGLPDHPGDLLEDLGYNGDYIISHLRMEPLSPFRASYAYTNYGLTEAGNAVADAAKTTWPDLAATNLFQPLGMNHTSYRRSDYDQAADKAAAHVQVDGHWQPSTTENADSQAPAGGASSTVDDLDTWMRLQLDNGSYNGKQIVDPAALDQTRIPHNIASQPRAPGGEPGFYGLGWNVNYDQLGRLRLNHSGAFDLGAATTVTLLPTEQLGIVVLTNGQPIGVPEAIAAAFFDIAQNGGQTVDWLSFYLGLFQALNNEGHSPTDYAKPPASPQPPKASSAYTGSYKNDYYGAATFTVAGNGQLDLVLGPNKETFPLTHHTGDTFSYRTRGENAVGLSGVTFHTGANGAVDSVTVENLDTTGLGTFTR